MISDDDGYDFNYFSFNEQESFFNFEESDFVAEDTYNDTFPMDESFPQVPAIDQPQESQLLCSVDQSENADLNPIPLKKCDNFEFYRTNAGIWMRKIFGKKIPSKSQLLNILKSLQIPWNDNHETQYLWKKVKNIEKLSYRDIRRKKSALLEYLSRVWDNPLYRQSLEDALLKFIQNQDRKAKRKTIYSSSHTLNDLYS